MEVTWRSGREMRDEDLCLKCDDRWWSIFKSFFIIKCCDILRLLWPHFCFGGPSVPVLHGKSS